MKWLIDVARYLKSNENGVLICIIGTLAQALHTYKIVVYSSQLEEEWMRQGQALMLGLFFSLGLVLYTFRAGSVPKEQPHLRDKYKKYARALAIFEFLVNMHYWTRYFIITKLEYRNEELFFDNITIMDWYDWMATIVYSFFLPFMIASYAGHVHIPDKITLSDNKLIKDLSDRLDSFLGNTKWQMGRNWRDGDKQYIMLKPTENGQKQKERV